MLTKYIEAAMKKAEYEKIEDGTYFGRIPGFQGLWSNEATLAACQDDLREALEGWLALGLWQNDPDIPTLGRLSLIPRKVRLRSRTSDEGLSKHIEDVKDATAEPPRRRKAS